MTSRSSEYYGDDFDVKQVVNNFWTCKTVLNVGKFNLNNDGAN